MKKIINLLVLAFFGNQLAFTQSISIELSVIWVKEHNIFKEDSILNFPELHITYRNNSDTSYYLLKVSQSKKGNPMLPWGTFLQYPIEEYLYSDYKKRAISHQDYTNNHYTVKIGGSPLYSEGWTVYNDTLNTVDEQGIDYINDDLADIYYYMYYLKYGKETDNKIYFSRDEIGITKIEKTVKSAFVFLKPGEFYTDKYNLIAFKEVGGNFTFELHDKLFDYVLIEPAWDNNLLKFLIRRIPLPKQVGKYKLYSGSYKTNKVIISF